MSCCMIMGCCTIIIFLKHTDLQRSRPRRGGARSASTPGRRGPQDAPYGWRAPPAKDGPRRRTRRERNIAQPTKATRHSGPERCTFFLLWGWLNEEKTEGQVRGAQRSWITPTELPLGHVMKVKSAPERFAL